MLSSEDEGSSADKEALLITLHRPVIFILPSSFDRGNTLVLFHTD